MSVQVQSSCEHAGPLLIKYSKDVESVMQDYQLKKPFSLLRTKWARRFFINRSGVTVTVGEDELLGLATELHENADITTIPPKDKEVLVPSVGDKPENRDQVSRDPGPATERTRGVRQ